MMSELKAEHWPWHVAVYHRMDKPVPEYQCGGTVINSHSILTAGHCVAVKNMNEAMEASKVVVSLGRLDLVANETNAQNFDVIFHLTTLRRIS